MKATLEFTLPEEAYELDTCRAAQELRGALVDIRELTRAKLKYAALTKSERALVEEIRELLPFTLLEG